MKQTLRLGTVSGIPVGLNWGLAAVAALYLVSLSTSLFPSAVPDASTLSYWSAGLAAVVLFFASVLAHEIGHAVVAQREGIRVRSITLWLLGGVAELEDEATTPGAEFRIAAAGPAVSLLLGGTFLGASLALAAVAGDGLAPTTLGWLGLINLVLALFNLVPAAPLDGGRILAAALWKRSGRPYDARRRAATAGQVFGYALVMLGTFTLLDGGTFWPLILGWFLTAAATSEKQRARLFAVARVTSAGDTMTRLAAPTDGGVTIAGLMAMGGSGVEAMAFPVRSDSGVLVGIVPGAGLERRARGHGASTRADAAMVGWERFVSARTDEPLEAVIRRFRHDDRMHAVVYDDADRLVGYIGMGELARARARGEQTPEPLVAA